LEEPTIHMLTQEIGDRLRSAIVGNMAQGQTGGVLNQFKLQV
jgi:hypothetical protein